MDKTAERTTESVISWILFLVVAAVCAWIAQAVVPGVIPGGFLIAAVVGVIGAWIGSSLLGKWGPNLAGIFVVPAIIGSAILVAVLSLISALFQGFPPAPPAG